jgi:peptidoglycan hydrolase-like protein with peptidoglycan-binding domain
MTKLKHVAFAGITALAFSQIAFAGGGYDKQGQSGAQSEPSARQEQQPAASMATAPGVEQDTIKQAQEKLSSKGHDVQADGVLGPKTQAALKEFQQKEGIQASGRLDQETLAALGVDEASAGAGSTSGPSSEPAAKPQS